jgi:hypothetical protein
MRYGILSSAVLIGTLAVSGAAYAAAPARIGPLTPPLRAAGPHPIVPAVKPMGTHPKITTGAVNPRPLATGRVGLPGTGNSNCNTMTPRPASCLQ